MKYLKMLGLMAVAGAALMALAATASATTITSPTGTAYTGTVKMEAEAAIKIGGSFTQVECKKSTIEEKIETHGAGVTASGAGTNVSVGECNFPTTVAKFGKIEIHAATAGSEVNGTVTSTGAEIKVNTSVGECIFSTNATDIGTLTGSQATGSSGTLDVSATIPRTGGSFLCGSSGTLSGSWKSVIPTSTWIDS
jgi:hypothetical protein